METIKELLDRFDQLNSVGAALSKEHHLPRLLEQILIAAQDLTHADGGTVYLLDDEKKALTFEIMRNDSMGIAMGGTTGKAINFPPLSLIKPDGQPNNALVATYTALNDQTVTVADAYFEQGFDFSGTRGFDKATGYRSQSFLTVPLKNHENVVIGVLQLINAKDPISGQTIPFSTTNQRLAESLASQASIALSNRQLITQLTDLFEALVNLINAAIDEKSPYTSGHCQRVPELTMILAEATEAMESGPYADFTMTDKDRYELRLAGLLHDCGKIVTPVHVVDKATKLQTLFDRIELVETRIELLKRDARIR
ncbi:MAG: GAF domain-containing protein, partial [Rhodoferax sp.]|nr:GAF domain-containing protein [Rhodoferax sp.]